jgi:ribosomal protein S28E/S33
MAFTWGNISHEEGVIILEGKYQNRNIYVANPYTNNGVGYCTYEVRVNGDIISDEVNGKAFEIDLQQFDLNTGEKVIIEIKHKGGCAPKVLNPGGLRPKPTFVTNSIDLDNTGFLEWTTTNEAGALNFIVQQYKWNKWVDVGQVTGEGTPSANNYGFKVKLTSGVNKFRVMQRNYEGKIKKSTSIELVSDLPKLTFVYNNRSKEIVFSSDTQYEIHDEFGRMVKRGFASSVDVEDLIKGDFYLSYDNSTDSFTR